MDTTFMLVTDAKDTLVGSLGVNKSSFHHGVLLYFVEQETPIAISKALFGAPTFNFIVLVVQMLLLEASERIPVG